jgi:hypothetical protein
MEYPSTIELLLLVFGNGILVTLIGFAFQHHQHNSERDFEARKVAREYYMTLYAHIGIIDELTKSYVRSINNGKAEVFSYEKCLTEVQTSAKIFENYKLAVTKFTEFYLTKSKEAMKFLYRKSFKNY